MKQKTRNDGEKPKKNTATTTSTATNDECDTQSYKKKKTENSSRLLHAFRSLNNEHTHTEYIYNLIWQQRRYWRDRATEPVTEQERKCSFLCAAYWVNVSTLASLALSLFVFVPQSILYMQLENCFSLHFVQRKKNLPCLQILLLFAIAIIVISISFSLFLARLFSAGEPPPRPLLKPLLARLHRQSKHTEHRKIRQLFLFPVCFSFIL